MPFAPHVSVVIGRRRTLAAVLIGLAVGAIGCVESREPAPEACAASAVEVELTLTTSSLNPGDPSACRGQVVTLRIESEVEGMLHVHGYDAELIPIDVGPGLTTEISFDATRSGQFPIELHSEQDSDGSTVGILTVYEP